MAHIDKPVHPDGPARARAREATERAAVAREQQVRQQRIDALKALAEKRFGRLNRTIVYSVLWIGVLGALFLAFAWYSNDIFLLLADQFGFGPDAADKAKGK